MRWTAVAALAAALSAVAAPPQRELGIPPALAKYRSWTRITPAPRRLPSSAAAACAPVMSAKDVFGPHDDRWIVVYANAAALAGLATKNAKVFPVGSVLVKEKRLRPDDAVPEGVGVMTRRRGGWEFAYYPSGGARASYDGCAGCHRAGGAKDSVFSSLSR